MLLGRVRRLETELARDLGTRRRRLCQQSLLLRPVQLLHNRKPVRERARARSSSVQSCSLSKIPLLGFNGRRIISQTDRSFNENACFYYYLSVCCDSMIASGGRCVSPIWGARMRSIKRASRAASRRVPRSGLLLARREAGCFNRSTVYNHMHCEFVQDCSNAPTDPQAIANS